MTGRTASAAAGTCARYTSSRPMRMPFDRTGASEAVKRFGHHRMAYTARKVAAVPTIISAAPKGLPILARKHPAVRPGTHFYCKGEEHHTFGKADLYGPVAERRQCQRERRIDGRGRRVEEQIPRIHGMSPFPWKKAVLPPCPLFSAFIGHKPVRNIPRALLGGRHRPFRAVEIGKQASPHRSGPAP